MAATLKGFPGGALKASVSTSGVAIDLTPLARCRVKIWSDDGDLWFSFAESAANTTLVTAGDSAASTSTLVADRTAKGLGAIRVVSASAPYLIAAHVSGSGTVRIKRVSHADGAE